VIKSTKEDNVIIGVKKDEFRNNENAIEKLTEDVRKKYPFSLTVKHIIELTGYSQATVYRMLECGEIPGAKKVMGWRVPRDVFLAWWLADGVGVDEVI